MTRRLFLLPGLGADERLFSALEPLCLPVITPRLPVPHPHESLQGYSLRVAAMLDLRPEDWIGGCSFGSVVAADIARRRPVKGLVLIGGALGPGTLVTTFQWLAFLRPLIPIRGLRPLLSNHTILSFGFGTVPEIVLELLLSMIRETPDTMLTEGARMLSVYHPAIPPLCPVHAIHGALDRIMRPPPVRGGVVLHDAGHALALSHPHDVSTFLRKVIC